MKQIRWVPALLFLSVALLVPAPSHPTARGIQMTSRPGQTTFLYKDYYALVVGVGKYTKGWPELPGALKDSEEIAAALEDYGFKVKLVRNPSSRELKKAITEMVFVEGKERDRALLLYFAGHGDTLNLADGNALGYIIPADCPLKDKDPIGFDDLAISMKEMEALALKVQCKHVLMVFDSCFSGSLFNLVRAAPVEISEKSVTPVRQFITAGGEGEQVPDKSVFKRVFLDGIEADADLNNDGYVTGSELGMHLQTKVVNYSRGGQHPQYGKINNPKLDKGDFIFVPKATRQKQEMDGRKAETDKAAASSEELKRLQEERKKNEELLEKLRQMLEARVSTEEAQKKRSIEEQKELETRLTAEKKKQVSTVEAEEKISRMEAQQKALEEEVRRLRADSQKTSYAVSEAPTGKSESVKVASIPQEPERLGSAEPAQEEANAASVLQEPERLGLTETAPEEVRVASIPQEVKRLGLAEPENVASGRRLAIFPMHLPDPGYGDKNRAGLLKNMLITVDTADLFGEVLSFYHFENRPDVQVLAKDLENKEIWKRKSVFSNLEPDMDIVCEQGKKLGLDAVVTLSVDVDRANVNYHTYLIDVAKRKTYSATGSHPRNTGAAGHEVRRMTQKMLDEYRKDR